MNKNASAKCDKHGCSDKAVAIYTIGTLYGPETWLACRNHIREIREMHGMNIQKVVVVA